MRAIATLLIAMTAASVVAGAARAAAPGDAAGAEFFEKHVRPVLVSKCQSCHGPKRQQGGLRLDSRTALLKGGDNGAVVVPGEPEKSLLVKAIRYDGDVQMPPKGKLPDEAIAHLSAWIKMGAPWPEDSVKADQQPRTVAEVRRKHWAFQPVKKPVLPAVKKNDWVKSPIDAFVLAGLEAKGLTPSPAAERRTLIRRLTLDLHGLPPTPEEVAAFEADRAPDAYARLVDRLLASPRYGERWGRHWLDVARYADSKGYVFQEERRYPFAYTYRDYVIRAFNDDLPYDQFVLQQLPPGAVARLGTARFRHNGNVRSLVFSPHDPILAALTAGGTILWDARTGKEIRRLPVITGSIIIGRLIDFSPDKRILAGAQDSNHVGLWDVSTGKQLRTFAVLPNNGGAAGGCPIHTIRFSPDGKFLAIGGGSHGSSVLDAATGKVLHRFQDEHVNCPTFSPDGKLLAMEVFPSQQTKPSEVQLCEFRTGKTVRRWQGHSHLSQGSSELICDFAFSPDGKMLAAAGTDRITIWNVATGEVGMRIEKKMGQIMNLAFTPDGKTLTSGSDDG